MATSHSRQDSESGQVVRAGSVEAGRQDELSELEATKVCWASVNSNPKM